MLAHPQLGFRPEAAADERRAVTVQSVLFRLSKAVVLLASE
jgi:hypothetical protein